MISACDLVFRSLLCILSSTVLSMQFEGDVMEFKEIFFPMSEVYFGPQFGLGDRVGQDLASQVRSWDFYPSCLCHDLFSPGSPPNPLLGGSSSLFPSVSFPLR